MSFILDREKYLRIRDADGIAGAVTTLHNDMWKMELETFETEEGYRPELWDALQEMRAFSRELWNAGVARPELLEGTKVPDPSELNP